MTVEIQQSNGIAQGPSAEATRSDAGPVSAATLKRQLTLLDVTMINVGTMIGSGIFFVPAAVALHVQSAPLILLVWGVGGLVSLLGALCIAELGAAMPRTGGQYVYLREAYGPLYGFLYGWTTFTVINTASIAAVAVAFTTALDQLMPMPPSVEKAAVIVSILILTGINALGVKTGAWTQNCLTFLKMGALALLALGGLWISQGAWGIFSQGLPVKDGLHLSSILALAMVSVLWAYDGWIQMTYVAGEIQEPQRNIPKALIFSTFIVILLYTLVNLSYLLVLSPAQLAQSQLPASQTAEAFIGPIGALLVTGAIVISTLGANNGFILTGARIYYAMACQGMFFRPVATLGKNGVPQVSLLVQCLWACALALTGTFEQLLTYVVFASWLFYAMSCGAVLILRRKAPQLERPYKVWGYPVTPLLFILFALWLVVNTVLEAPREALIGLGLICTGLPVYWFWTRKNSNEPACY